MSFSPLPTLGGRLCTTLWTYKVPLYIQVLYAFSPNPKPPTAAIYGERHFTCVRAVYILYRNTNTSLYSDGKYIFAAENTFIRASHKVGQNIISNIRILVWPGKLAVCRRRWFGAFYRDARVTRPGKTFIKDTHGRIHIGLGHAKVSAMELCENAYLYIETHAHLTPAKSAHISHDGIVRCLCLCGFVCVWCMCVHNFSQTEMGPLPTKHTFRTSGASRRPI